MGHRDICITFHNKDTFLEEREDEEEGEKRFSSLGKLAF